MCMHMHAFAPLCVSRALPVERRELCRDVRGRSVAECAWRDKAFMVIFFTLKHVNNTSMVQYQAGLAQSGAGLNLPQTTHHP